MPKEDLMAFSIFIAGAIATIRFSHINKKFLPFLLLTWIAGANEALSYWLMVNGHHTAINNNLYVLAESILLLTFYKNMTVFEKKPSIYKIYVAGLVVIWLAENIWLGKITQVSSIFRIASSASLAFISISLLSKAMILGSVPGATDVILHLNRRPVMLICTGVVIFFTFKVLVEIFWFYGLSRSELFRVMLYDILIFVNLVVNLIYAIAMLWIRKKPRFMMLY